MTKGKSKKQKNIVESHVLWLQEIVIYNVIETSGDEKIYYCFKSIAVLLYLSFCVFIYFY